MAKTPPISVSVYDMGTTIATPMAKDNTYQATSLTLSV